MDGGGKRTRDQYNDWSQACSRNMVNQGFIEAVRSE
jgi:hypothetical protein